MRFNKTFKLENVNKILFRHNEAIQALSFNPITNVLITCAVSDFGNYHK